MRKKNRHPQKKTNKATNQNVKREVLVTSNIDEKDINEITMISSLTDSINSTDTKNNSDDISVNAASLITLTETVPMEIVLDEMTSDVLMINNNFYNRQDFNFADVPDNNDTIIELAKPELQIDTLESDTLNNQLIGNIDSCDENGINGWVLDKRGLGGWQLTDKPIEPDVDIIIDGQVIARVTANLFRHDLADALIGDGGCAFYIPMPERFFDGVEHSIEIRESVNDNKIESKLSYFCLAKTPYTSEIEDISIEKVFIDSIVDSIDTVELEASNSHLIGNIDSCDENGINGWVLDKCGLGGWQFKEKPNEPEVDIIIDGQFIARVTANLLRQDLANALIGDGQCAFYIAMPERFSDGIIHDIEIQESNNGKKIESKLSSFYIAKIPYTSEIEDIGIEKVFIDSTVDSSDTVELETSNSQLIGNIDFCDEKGISGWVLDKRGLGGWQLIDKPIEPDVDIFIDDELIAHVTANLFRQDLADALIGDGGCAFYVPMPERFFDGIVHNVEVKEKFNNKKINCSISNFFIPVKNIQQTSINYENNALENRLDNFDDLIQCAILTSGILYIDHFLFSETGFILIIGWINDQTDVLNDLSVRLGNIDFRIKFEQIHRYRRRDTENHLMSHEAAEHGFWCFLNVAQLPYNSGFESTIIFRLNSGVSWLKTANVIKKNDKDIFNMIMAFFISIEVKGHGLSSRLNWLDNGLGHEILSLNKLVVDDNMEHIVSVYAPKNKKYKRSIVVVLYGKSEYLFLQMALFSNNNDIKDTQFIYVINSPHIIEEVRREAKLAFKLYGLSIFIVQMKGNVGFSMGNNVGVRYAQSERILIVNPDVFPKSLNWLELHDAFIEKYPTDIVGARLYYDDGSVMHAGMYFERDDINYSFSDKKEQYLARVEHYCKGSPDGVDIVETSRIVPAVTGAFMSVDKGLFEKIGGFSRDYIFGHYEDADLCLKFRQLGFSVRYASTVKLWHLEGKGSAKNELLESASFVNRWSFTRKWKNILQYEND